MRPITKIKSRTMSKAMRTWLKAAVEAAGFPLLQGRIVAYHVQPWHGPAKPRVSGNGRVYLSPLSAAKAAGIRMVPAI